MNRVLMLLVASWAATAAAQVRSEAQEVGGRTAWLAAGGAALTAGGAAVLGLGLWHRGWPVETPAYARSTREIVGGTALLVFGVHVGLLAMIGALWPLGAAVVPLPGGGAAVSVQGPWP